MNAMNIPAEAKADSLLLKSTSKRHSSEEVSLCVRWDDVQQARQLLLVHLATCHYLPSFTHY